MVQHNPHEPNRAIEVQFFFAPTSHPSLPWSNITSLSLIGQLRNNFLSVPQFSLSFINPALQPNSSGTLSKTAKELKPMLFKPVQCQSGQTKCTQCCTFHLLRFCSTNFWFSLNFGIVNFSASQCQTCQTKLLNAGLAIFPFLH